MSENTDTANDYALARLLNEREIHMFSLLDTLKDLPDFSALNRSYVLLREELIQIYDRQPELQNVRGDICWRVMPNIELFHENIGEYKTIAFEYANSGSDYGQHHNADVTTLCIKAGISKPVIPPRIQKLLSEADNNIKAFQYELDKMNAKLSIEGFSIPVVTVGETKYHFSSMRDGPILSIIAHCLSNHPNEQIDFVTLKSELKELNIKVPAKFNIKDQIRTSHFGAGKPLSPFVTAFPKAVIVRSTVELSDEQIEQIRLAKA